jgi:hypothetical protein
MSILHHVSPGAARGIAVTTLLFAGIGFVSGFLLSLAVAAHSLYSCTVIL